MACSINVLKLILLISFMFSTYSTFCEPCCCCKKNVKSNLGNSGNSGSSRLINKGGLSEDEKKKDEGEEKSDKKEGKEEDENSVSEENKSEGEEKSEDKKSENSVAGKEESNVDESKENKSCESHSRKSEESEEDSKSEDLSMKEKPTEDNIIESIKGYIKENLEDIDFKGIAGILGKTFKRKSIKEFKVYKNKSTYICVECGKCKFFSKDQIDSLIKSYTVPEAIIFDEMWLYVHDSGKNYIKITDDYTLGYIVSSLCSLPKELRPYWNHHYLKLESDCEKFEESCDIYFDITNGVFYYKDKIDNLSSSSKTFYREEYGKYGLFCIMNTFKVNANCYSNGYFVRDDYKKSKSDINSFSNDMTDFGYDQLNKNDALESFHIVS